MPVFPGLKTGFVEEIVEGLPIVEDLVTVVNDV